MSAAGSPLRRKVCLYFASKLHPFNSGEEHHSPKMREGDDLKQGAQCCRQVGEGRWLGGGGDVGGVITLFSDL